MVCAKPTEEKKRIRLYDEQGNLSTDATSAFSSIFQMYSTNGKMSVEQYVNLIKNCTSNQNY
jgi:hypothetical protein